MRDFILELTYEADSSLDEAVQSELYLSSSSGNSMIESTGVVRLAAYFDNAEDRDAAAARFAALKVKTNVFDRERLDWLDVYQQSLTPIYIGDRFLVAPDPSLIRAESDRLTIIVPQEQAFGTGSHETTALCISALERLPVEGRRMMDVGAGSGILAIAAYRLGALRVIAFDNDVDAYGALRDNRLRNAVPDEAMQVFIGSVEALRGGTFDVITMNIIPEVILPLLPEVLTHLSPQGLLLLSGILVTRRNDVVDAASAAGLTVQSEAERGEWWCGVFSSE